MNRIVIIIIMFSLPALVLAQSTTGSSPTHSSGSKVEPAGTGKKKVSKDAAKKVSSKPKKTNPKGSDYNEADTGRKKGTKSGLKSGSTESKQ